MQSRGTQRLKTQNAAVFCIPRAQLVRAQRENWQALPLKVPDYIVRMADASRAAKVICTAVVSEAAVERIPIRRQAFVQTFVAFSDSFDDTDGTIETKGGGSEACEDAAGVALSLVFGDVTSRGLQTARSLASCLCPVTLPHSALFRNRWTHCSYW